jgi:hypothetical protein
MNIVILLLIVIAGLLALPFVLLARRRQAGGGISAAEVVTYLILVVATLIATNSISSLLELLIPGDDVIVGGAESLALSLSTLIVAGIVAVIIWIALERRSVPRQARPTRDLYLSIVIGVAIGFVASALIRLGLWAVGADEFSAGAVSDLVAFGGVWFLHERFRRPPEELDELRQLAGSFIGVSLSVAGVSIILSGSLSIILQAGRVIVGDRGLWGDIRSGVVVAAVGAPLLWWFWLRGLASRPGPWRNAYAVIVAIAGWIAAFISLGTALSIAAQAIVGLDGQAGGIESSALPEALTGSIVGSLVYWHHRGVLGRPRTNAIRVIEYFLGAFGLVAGSGAVVVLASTAIRNLVGERSPLLVDDSRVTVMALVVLLLAAAAVIRYWLPVLKLGGDPGEARSAPRKASVLILLIGFAVTGAGALIAVLFVLLRAALEGEARGLGDEIDWSVSLVIVSAAMGWHLAGLRPSKQVATSKAQTVGAAMTTTPVASAPDRVGTVTLVAADPGPLPALLPGLRFLRRADGVGSVDQATAERIVQSLAEVSAPAALVTVDENGFSVVLLA